MLPVLATWDTRLAVSLYFTLNMTHFVTSLPTFKVLKTLHLESRERLRFSLGSCLRCTWQAFLIYSSS